jgi:hypothetical protein
VNKVESGVLMRHLPSGVSVRCTQERSQLMNRAIALETLRAKLLVVKMEQKVRGFQKNPPHFLCLSSFLWEGEIKPTRKGRERERGKGRAGGDHREKARVPTILNGTFSIFFILVVFVFSIFSIFLF